MNKKKKSLYISRRVMPVCLALLAGTGLAIGQENENEDEEQVFDLEEFEVYGSAQMAASELKRGSDVIGSFLGTDAIGDLPDDTLGAALTRLAGVNVVGESAVSIRGVEGKLNSVRIDGVDFAQADTSWGPDGVSRNFDVSAVPAEVVKSVEVIKSVLADQDADAVGGIVNVRTHNSFDANRLKTSYKVEGRYRELGEQKGYGFSVRQTNPVSEKFGYSLDFSYRDEDYWDNDVEYRQAQGPEELPSGVSPELERIDVRNTVRTQKRYNLTGSLDYRFNENSFISLKPYYSRRDQTRFRNRVRMRDLDEREGSQRPFGGAESVWWFEDENGNPLGEWIDFDGDGVLGGARDNFVPLGAIADENGAIQDDSDVVITPRKQSSEFRLDRRYRPDEITYETFGLSILGETLRDRFLLSYKLAYNESTKDTTLNEVIFDQFSSVRDFQRFRYDSTDPWKVNVEAFLVTEKEGHIPVEPKVDVYRAHDRLGLGSIRYLYEDVDVSQLVAQIDLTVADVVGDWDLKTGLKNRSIIRDAEAAPLDFTPDSSARIPFSEMEGAFGRDMPSFDSLWSYTGPTLNSVSRALEVYESNPEAFSRSFGDEYVIMASGFSKSDESITAAYLQTRGSIGPVQVIAGVRMEYTESDVTWKASQLPGLDGIDPLDDITDSKDYTNYFPSILGVYRFGQRDEFVIRAAYTTTLARPDWADQVPYDTDVVNFALEQAGEDATNANLLGNPNLVEQTADNYDISFEWYYGDASNISIAFFRKEMENFLMNTTVERELPDIDPETGEQEIDPVTGEGETRTVRSTFVVNSAEREIDGMEVSWLQSFDFLPNPFDGFSVIASYTYTTGKEIEPIFDDPKAVLDGDFTPSGFRTGSRLQGQPENIINLQVIYEKGPVNVRLAYLNIDEIKRETFDVAFPTLEGAMEVYDLSIQYRLSKGLRLFADIKNLTEEGSKRYQGNQLFPESWGEAKRQWVVGVRGTF
jgi:TonB-dependent receptor